MIGKYLPDKRNKMPYKIYPEILWKYLLGLKFQLNRWVQFWWVVQKETGVLVCSPGRPWTCGDPAVSASWVLYWQACGTMPGKSVKFWMKIEWAGQGEVSASREEEVPTHHCWTSHHQWAVRLWQKEPQIWNSQSPFNTKQKRILPSKQTQLWDMMFIN